MNDLSKSEIFPFGQENTEYAQYFAGKSYLNMLSAQGVVIGDATFEPGCRNNHRHPVCTVRHPGNLDEFRRDRRRDRDVL